MRAKRVLLSICPLLLALAAMACTVCQPPPRISLPSRTGWTTISNGNDVHQVAFDERGALWAVTSGGVVRWNLEDGTYTKSRRSMG